MLDELNRLNVEMVPGARTEKQGDFHDKLSRLIQRLESKRTDCRLGFFFPAAGIADDYAWLDEMVTLLLGSRAANSGRGGVKVIDFSKVSSDILPLIVCMMAPMTFHVPRHRWRSFGRGSPLHPSG